MLFHTEMVCPGLERKPSEASESGGLDWGSGELCSLLLEALGWSLRSGWLKTLSRPFLCPQPYTHSDFLGFVPQPSLQNVVGGRTGIE